MMLEPITHADEPGGNAVRTRLAAAEGRGQHTYTPTQTVVTRAEGSVLHTADGRRLIDFAAGVLVANIGHNHAGFEARLRAYLAGLPRTSYNFLTPVQAEAAERLAASTGLPQRKVLWAASGSEGVQKAMWCARHRYPERPIMLATCGGFHGKKGLAGDVTMGGTHPDVRWVSFPRNDAMGPADLQRELDALARQYPGRISLLITEPYLGAAGSYHPPAWYHPLLQDWCRAHDVALIFDEVQSCHGRTGRMYAFETYGVAPDLVVLGKGLGSGVPVAAVVGRADLIDALDYGEASDTFSANPEACAAVCATLDVFEQEDIVARAAATGKDLHARLETLMRQTPGAMAVRGEGMVYGLEFDTPARACDYVLAAYHASAGTGVHFLGPLAGKVLRVSPPLTIDAPTLDEAFALLHAAWRAPAPAHA